MAEHNTTKGRGWDFCGTAVGIFSPTRTSTSSKKESIGGDKRDTEDVFEFVGEGPIEFADTASRNDEESTGTNVEEEEAGTYYYYYYPARDTYGEIILFVERPR